MEVEFYDENPYGETVKISFWEQKKKVLLKFVAWVQHCQSVGMPFVFTWCVVFCGPTIIFQFMRILTNDGKCWRIQGLKREAIEVDSLTINGFVRKEEANNTVDPICVSYLLYPSFINLSPYLQVFQLRSLPLYH